MKKYDNVPLETQKSQYEQWVSVLNPGNMGNVYFLPWVGMAYRMEQFIKYCGKGVEIVDLQALDGEGVELIKRLPTKGKLIILLKEVLLSPDGLKIALAIEQWLVGYEGGVLFVHEASPTRYRELARLPSWVMARQMLYHLTDSLVVRQYVGNVARELGVSLNSQEIEELVRACGGWLWLVKDVIRSKASKQTRTIQDCIQDDSFVQKMGLIWKSWPELYQKVVLGVVEDELVQSEMQLFGIIDQKEVQSERLAQYIKSKTLSEIEISDERVSYRQRDLSDKFTRGERAVLANLWESKSREGLLLREKIPELYVGLEMAGEMSDWTIDQKMKRLREKLKKLQIPLEIVTKKGEGYGVR